VVINDVPRPDSAVAATALEVVREFSSPALVNHCIRSFIWASAYAIEHDLTYDVELLYVSAMLHDIGLVSAFDNVDLPFEIAGGNVAWVFGAGAGWPPERRVRAAEVIDRHMWDEVDPAEDPEGYLLCIATGLDISGRNPDWWPAELRRRVVASHPRLDLAREFAACFESQARRKPSSSAAAAISSGLGDRLASNVLDEVDPGA
jgi:hypothetical protein